MKPFKSTTMLRPLTDAELQLEDPQWEDDDTVTFYIPCWSTWILFFSRPFMWLRNENDDYINLLLRLQHQDAWRPSVLHLCQQQWG